MKKKGIIYTQLWQEVSICAICSQENEDDEEGTDDERIEEK